jgi:hypothetical protein
VVRADWGVHASTVTTSTALSQVNKRTGIFGVAVGLGWRHRLVEVAFEQVGAYLPAVHPVYVAAAASGVDGDVGGVGHHGADLLLGDGFAFALGFVVEAVVLSPGGVAEVWGDVSKGLGATTVFTVVFGVIVEGGLLRAAGVYLFEIL